MLRRMETMSAAAVVEGFEISLRTAGAVCAVIVPCIFKGGKINTASAP